MLHVLVNNLPPIYFCWDVPNAIYFAAIFVFLSARRLFRNIVVFYLVGVLLGLSLSFLLFGYLLQRILPFPSVTKIPLFFGGWPLSFYIYYLIWTDIELLFRHYKLYAILYLCFFGLVSFAACYRIGPPSDIRTLNLIVWSLRLFALLTIYFFSLNRFRGIASVIFLLVVSIWWKYRRRIHTFVKVIQRKLSTFIYGPQQRKLLTEAEYREEVLLSFAFHLNVFPLMALIYTQMELDKLRRHLQSRQTCDVLRLISNLRTPNRTSSFITGSSEHVSPEEKGRHFELFGCSDIQQNADETDEYITDDD